MTGTVSNERLMRFLQATPEQREAIDRIFDGRTDVKPAALTGPLLLGMGAGAKLLGVSRATLWRMIRAGKLAKVEVLPGSYRVRRADVERIANGEGACE
jgi:excisionase family DNA binding protein